MRRGKRGSFFAVACLIAGLSPGGSAAMSGLDEQAALRTSQAAIGRQIGPYTLTDSHGSPVDLRSLGGRPALVSFIYTSCAHTCPIITQRLAAAVNEARDVLGEGRFSVLTIGFDAPTDSPERMRDYALQRHMDTRDWYFLSGDPDTMRRLTAEFGFVYIPAPHGYDHLAQVSVLDGSGRLQSQIYGDDFPPAAVVEPLRQLLLGSTGTLAGSIGILDRIRLFCTVYDPASGRYGFDYSLLLVVMTGIMSLGGILYFIITNWRQSARKGESIGAPKGLPR